LPFTKTMEELRKWKNFKKRFFSRIKEVQLYKFK